MRGLICVKLSLMKYKWLTVLFFLLFIFGLSFSSAQFFGVTAARPPSPPRRIQIQSQENSIKILWKKPRKSNYFGYRIYRSTVRGNLGELLWQGNVKERFLQDVNMHYNTKYFYTVRTFGATGIESPNKKQYTAFLKRSPISQEPIIIQQLTDANGRISESIRSSVPKNYQLKLNLLTNVSPESVGKNYFSPGTYRIKVGDGFGKGDFLIKFTKFNPGTWGNIEFAVFKKEANGKYYYFPTQVNTISPDLHGYWGINGGLNDPNFILNDLFEIVIEVPVDASNFDEVENTLVYHTDCNVSNFSADGKESSRCSFDPGAGEAKVEYEKYTVILPYGYSDLAHFVAQDLEQCYANTIDFLGFDSGKPRIGAKMRLGQENSALLGLDEHTTSISTKSWFDDETFTLPFKYRDITLRKCPVYFSFGHELTHVLSKGLLTENIALNEGLADFVAFQNGQPKLFLCSSEGWKRVGETTVKPYINVSSSGGTPDYYATGYCFWDDFITRYGYPTFVSLMQNLYQKSHEIEDYYFIDVFENTIGGSLDSLFTKYSLTRAATHVKGCKGCDIFVAEN